MTDTRRSQHFITKAPPTGERPQCPRCGKRLRPSYRVVSFGHRRAREAGAQPFSDAALREFPDHVEFTGSYLGPVPFCTKTCATRWAIYIHRKLTERGMLTKTTGNSPKEDM